ncbi:ribosomal L7Ae/L30e/S12e/Gadd45 family protein [Candidatus Woesearchaeota archaeon]|nr:ribosomal L7Ae/L30e/S12e/Gadd45 family protein [Candidatus Woesearchaeota archaeon]
MANLKNDLETKKAILGFDVTLKKLRNGKLSRVYVANNCPRVDTLINLAKMNNVEVISLSENSKELGVLVKKSFSIGVVGFE